MKYQQTGTKLKELSEWRKYSVKLGELGYKTAEFCEARRTRLHSPSYDELDLELLGRVEEPRDSAISEALRFRGAWSNSR